MPAKSKSQQRLFGMVHAYQKGKLKDAPESVKEIARSISDEDAEHFAKTKHKGLPEKKAYIQGFMDKCAASKLRGMLNAGKLSLEQIERLRGLGMLQSRKQYVEGARKMLKSRLESIFRHAEDLHIPLTINTGAPRAQSGHSWKITVDNYRKMMFGVRPSRKNMPNALPGRPLDPSTGEHILNIPGNIRITTNVNNGRASAIFNTSKTKLHDIITANHELDEYLGYFRNGGNYRWHNPMSVLGDLVTHQPGVLRNERMLYERLARQLGVKNPNWGNFRLDDVADGSRRAGFRPEVVRSTFTGRDEASLRRLLSGVSVTPEDMSRLGGVMQTDFAGMWNMARKYTNRAARLARKRGLKKLEAYFKSNPVAYYTDGNLRTIATPNYLALRNMLLNTSPEVSTTSVKELKDFFNGAGA
jgi:hypothetical protein